MTLFFCSADGFSQTPGIPIALQERATFNEDFFKDMASYTLPALDNNYLKQYADSLDSLCVTCSYNKHYGYGIINTIDIKNEAQYYNPNILNGKLWIFKITSSTALGLQFYFSKFNLPVNSFLHIYSLNGSRTLGPYTSANNPRNLSQGIDFGTMPIESNEVYLEYYESNSASFSGELELGNIVHLYSGYTDAYNASAACQLDVACDPPGNSIEKSVALILTFDQFLNFAGVCTGTLLNNTDQDGTAYFLTAAHCVTSYSNTYLNALQFIFDWERSLCGGTEPEPEKIITGATMLERDDLDSCHNPLASDYALLRLHATPNAIATMGACYAGWSIDDYMTSPSNSYSLIHHPKGDVKKISKTAAIQGSLTATVECSSTITTTWLGSDFYDFDVTSGGSPQPGSSGAPLFDGNWRVIGTVTGGARTNASTPVNPCDPTTEELYVGRFKEQWEQGDFEDHLDIGGLVNPTLNIYGVDMYCPPYTPPPSNVTYQTLNDGFLVNTMDGLPILCSTNELYIEPAVEDKFKIRPFMEQHTQDEGGCDWELLFTPHWVCYFYSYLVEIQERDFNYNPIGPVYSHTYKIPTGQFTTSVNGYYIYINDFPITLLEGKLYNIRISSQVNGNTGGWYASERVIYILPNDLVINNATPFINLYAMNSITLQNVNIFANLDITATSEIKVLPESTLLLGHYFLEPIDCETFRSFIIPGVSDNYANNYFAPNIDSKNNSDINSNFVLFPNPSSGSFTITSNNQNLGNIKVTDMLGHVVYTASNVQANTTNVELKNVTPGIYLVEVNDGINKPHYSKIVIE